MSNTLKEWLHLSTQEQKELLAKLATTSVPSLRLASQGYRTEGAVNLTAEFAARIANAAAQIPDKTLPVIKVEELCKACHDCPYQKKCNSK